MTASRWSGSVAFSGSGVLHLSSVGVPVVFHNIANDMLIPAPWLFCHSVKLHVGLVLRV